MSGCVCVGEIRERDSERGEGIEGICVCKKCETLVGRTVRTKRGEGKIGACVRVSE